MEALPAPIAVGTAECQMPVEIILSVRLIFENFIVASIDKRRAGKSQLRYFERAISGTGLVRA